MSSYEAWVQRRRNTKQTNKQKQKKKNNTKEAINIHNKIED